MSRMTSAQVIAIGEYLEPDFDPASLTVSQLLGVFGFHNINYPSQYTKPKLVQLFNEEIKPKIKKLKRERVKRENSQASDDGIRDGVTGRPLSETTKPLRRSSRRVSGTLPQEQSEQSEPAPAKRRRSSAQPALGGTSRRKAAKPVEPVLIEESEPEEEIVVRKVGRSKKSTTDAASQARRVSQTLPEDSGWEDNNVFQSGAESSSPVRPSPVRTRARRSSAVPRPQIKSRKSMSAPPQYASESPEGKNVPEKPPSVKPVSTIKPSLSSKPTSRIKPPSSRFEPKLPPEVTRESLVTSSGARQESPSPQSSSAKATAQVLQSLQEDAEDSDLEPKKQLEALRQDVMEEPSELTEENIEEGLARGFDDETIEGQVAAVAQRISEGGWIVEHEESETGRFSVLRFILMLLALSSSGVLFVYKNESSQIGFCETGKSTNSILEERRERLVAIEQCNRENRTWLYQPDGSQSVSPPQATASPGASDMSSGSQEVLSSSTGAELCPPLPLLSYLHSDICTPCPPHATCSVSDITCEYGYILQSHPFLSFVPVPGTPMPSSPSANMHYTRPGSILSTSADIPQLVYSVVSTVFDGLPSFGPVAFPPRCVEDPRRKRHIGGLGKAMDAVLAAERGRRLCLGTETGESDGDEASEAKRWGYDLESLKELMRQKARPAMRSKVDETFDDAVHQLLQWGGVFMGEDADGTRYLAHRSAILSWDCAVKVKARDAWAEWRKSVMGTALLTLIILSLRRRRAQNAAEAERVASLVPVALALLQNQELRHHTDPVTAPYPYISSLQMRDMVLQDEHSVRTRQRLWERVEKVVESNANVRTNLEEVEGGDELRVWRWIGSTSGATDSGSASPKAEEEGQ